MVLVQADLASGRISPTVAAGAPARHVRLRQQHPFDGHGDRHVGAHRQPGDRRPAAGKRDLEAPKAPGGEHALNAATH
eukprot:SAG31_NODE_2407_length_5761_cov_7.258742_3_plen_78_part_00